MLKCNKRLNKFYSGFYIFKGVWYNMGILDKTKEKLIAKYSDWIKVEDNKSRWTIEDFPYVSGVDEDKTKPHCWKCVTVNRCWFKNEKEKKPETISNDKNLLDSILKQQGLYHINCHCEEIGVSAPSLADVKLLLLEGKLGYFFENKRGWYESWGYKESDVDFFIDTIAQLVRRSYSLGKYEIEKHTKYGVSINVFIDLPGINEKSGKFYKHGHVLWCFQMGN